MPRHSLLLLFLPALILYTLSEPCAAKQIWYEWGMATATVGWDTKNKRTLVQKYYLAAIGPDSIEQVAVGHVKTCLGLALKKGVDAYKAAPSPEVAARTAAAYGAFKLTCYACLTTVPATKDLKGQFEPSIVQRQEWQDGLSLKFHADNPSARNYRALGEHITKTFGGELGKASNQFLQIYADLQGLNLDIPLDDVELVANVLDAFARSSQGEFVVATVNDITELASDPLNPDMIRQTVSDLLANAGKRLKSLDSLGLAAAGIPDNVARDIEREIRDLFNDPENREFILAGANPGLILARKLGDKLPELKATVEKAATPTVTVGGEDYTYLPGAGFVPTREAQKLQEKGEDLLKNLDPSNWKF